MKTIKVKLYPNSVQRNLILQYGGASRYIYNYMLGLSKDIYEKNGSRPTGYYMNKLLVILKQQEQYSWLQNIHSQVLQQPNIRLDRAYHMFFMRLKQGKNPGFPRFKSKKYNLKEDKEVT